MFNLIPEMKTMKTYQNLTAYQQSTRAGFSTAARLILPVVFLFCFVMLSSTVTAQLGVYEFTGAGTCPHQNTAVAGQPSNAVFSNFSTVGATCNGSTDQYAFEDLNENSSINLGEYHQFAVTADPGHALNLASLSFTHRVSENGSGSGSGRTAWVLRSSINNYATNTATGSANETYQTPIIALPPANFSGISTVTFRFYIFEIKEDETLWTIDDVTLNGSVIKVPADPTDPTSDSPQCATPGVILTANGIPPTGETWYWQATSNGTSTANSGPTYTAISSGTYYLRSQDNTTLTWSIGAGSVTVAAIPDVSIPVFSSGTTSTRCRSAATVTYTASASYNTSLGYTLDATSIADGVTINSFTGAVTYPGGWEGVSVITATATGCNGPQISTHTATTNGPVAVPVFASGASSIRCLGASTINYTATATNSSSITYSIDLLSGLSGNTINSATGTVNFSALWVGNSVITATATGCGGSRTATHTVTVNSAVGTPLFLAGTNSSRCQGAATVTYTASAANTSGITYSLDAVSTTAGNSINVANGAVTYTAAWSGISIITASATGCSGPKTANHTVTINPPVTTPVFTLGATSIRCQGTGLVTYVASAISTTGITYSLNAAAIAGGNSINASTGVLSYSSAWTGATIITATATGCNGPTSATHTVSITPYVGVPVFTAGVNSMRCQTAATITYGATASNATTVTYSLDAASIAAGNNINTNSGAVTFTAGWSGNSTITATATGCNGPRISTHTVTSTPIVGVPVFVAGVVSTRTQSAETITYAASASNSTGIIYSLDPASLAGGNTINAATGEVTYSATWSGSSIITAAASGCAGPVTTMHTVTINATSVVKQLYLSDPSQSLDRIDPVNTGDLTTANTTILSTAGTTSTIFTMAPVLCDVLTIKAGVITVRNYVTMSSGMMPANPNVTATLRYGAITIITLTNPTFTSGINLLTWTATLAADVTIPAGQAITLRITTAQPAVNFRIDFDSQTKPSRIDLPVSTFISITSLNVYNAAYPAGLVVTTGLGGSTKYIRTTVTDPFGSADITGMNIKITPTGSTVAATSVATAGCTRTYEYVWSIPASPATYAISATAKEGYENTVTNISDINFNVCNTCAPAALNDSASGAGGTPVVIDVLANDNDPNNNINNASLAITIQPKNGSAYIANNMIVYLPNGAFQGMDTITYQVCDLSSPTPLCTTAQIFLTIDPLIIDICGDAAKTHTYYIPYPEDQSYIALQNSASVNIPSNNIRTIISVKVPYPGMKIVWDEWEDGYEANASNPTQSTTKVWGDGNPFNGIAPGYGSDIIPAGGSILLDNTMNANPRNPGTIYYDGKDKIVSSGQIAVTQVSAEPSIISVQSIKTNVTSTYDFGQSFTIPLGEDFPSRDFRYTALFIRASENNTVINIDKNNDGTFETTTTLNEGGSYLLDGGVLTGATVASNKPVGVELNAGGVDNYSIRNAPIYPATWYSNTYYTPVPTSDNAGDNPKDTSVVMFYNSLNRAININWYSGAPASGVIAVPAKSAVRFPLAYSTTSAYKFVNLGGESFTAIEMVGSYTPGGGGSSGSAYDWSFNLISEARLTDYTTVAWAPGGLDLGGGAGPDVNGNPIWVTPTANTTVYVKYDGNISGTGGLVSPCGLRYDVAYNVNALNYIKIKDDTDNDQSGIAIYTCNGAKIAAVYGEDPRGSTAGASSYWDVGSTIQPFCKQKIVIATDDFATTLVSQPVTISVLNNDFGFLAEIDPATVSTLGLQQPLHGTVTVNENGTILYIPNFGFSGVDTFEYRVCSTPSPIVCDVAEVIVKISTCPSNGNQNIISGQVFIDRNKDAFNNDGSAGLAGVKVYLYTDGNCSGTISSNELTDSVTVDSSGFYQFAKYPEKIIEDNFDAAGGGGTCANGTDGDTPWASNWTDAGDGSVGFCQSSASADVDIAQDGAFGFGLRLKDNDVSARRSVNLNGVTKAFLTFSYRRKSALNLGEDLHVQASFNGTAFTTIYTIAGTGTTDANYVTIYNQDISSYASANTAIRFLTDGSMDNDDSVYIDNVSIRYLKYPQCYITSINTASAPATYSLTTAGQKTVTINSGGTCTSQFDFGFGKPNVIVRGTLRNDKNGLTDNVVNGAATGSPDGVTVFAYLSDVSGNVAFKTTVNSANGTYSFPLAEINTDYRLIISTISVALGSVPPATLACPSLWVSVGDSYGTNNMVGSGVESGMPDAAIAVRTGMNNVTNVDFGIQRLPNSDNFLRSINEPKVNDFILLNGQGVNPPVLTGSDPEDCVVGCILTNRAVIIDTVPANSEMYYNNALVTDGQLITGFNPDLLQIKVTAAALGEVSISFWYSYVDAAVMKDLSPAKYTVVWLVPLTAQGFVASASLNSNLATIKWQTLAEQNTSYFVVERSLDNTTFKEIGVKTQAAGNSDSRRDYQVTDDVESIMKHPVIYYRVKLVDIDGKVSYSNVVLIRLSQKPGVTVWPNPFQSSITISVTVPRETTIDIKLIDVNGRVLKSATQQAAKGLSQINVQNLEKLPAGVYLVEITDKTAGTTFQKLLKNN
jgi:hypothetical protein